MPGPAIVEDAPVRGGRGVVRFVDDNGLKIRHEAGQPSAATQGLDAGHHRGGRMLVVRRLHDAEREGGIHEVELVDGLLDEFIPVCQDQGPPAAALHQEGKHNRLAGPGGQDEQRPLHPPCRGREQGRHGFVLVGAWGEPEGLRPAGGGRGSDHAAVSLAHGESAAQRRAAPRHLVSPVTGVAPAAWGRTCSRSRACECRRLLYYNMIYIKSV